MQVYQLLEPPTARGGTRTAEDARAQHPAGGVSGAEVVCIAVHPDMTNVFAVVIDMGAVAVFCAQRGTPACIWSCPFDTVAAVWLPGSASRLATVARSGAVTVVDVTADPCEPPLEGMRVRLPDRCSCIGVAASRMSGEGGAVVGSGGSTTADTPVGVLAVLVSDGSLVYHALGGCKEDSTAEGVYQHLKAVAW